MHHTFLTIQLLLGYLMKNKTRHFFIPVVQIVCVAIEGLILYTWISDSVSIMYISLVYVYSMHTS